MDIDDIRSKFGDKYDLGIQEVQNYTQELGDLTKPIEIRDSLESPQPVPKEVTPEERSDLAEKYGKSDKEVLPASEEEPIDPTSP